MRKKTKILSFGHIPSWAGGRQENGLSNVIYNLARYMAEDDDVEVRMAATDVFTPHLQSGSLHIYGWTRNMLLRYAVRHPFFTIRIIFHLMRCRRRYASNVNVAGMLFKAVFLRKCITDFQPDVVHLHAAHSIVYLPAIPRNIRIVMTHHGKVGGDVHIEGSDIYARIEKDCCQNKRLAMQFFIASRLIDDFQKDYGKIKSRVRAILNAYDGERFFFIAPKKHEKLTLMTIAALNENKGQERILQAMAQTGMECRYVCIGADKEGLYRQLETFAHEKGLDFLYAGTKKPVQIREMLAEADFMIMPSSTEGFGLVYLEAMACGVPVVLPRNLPIVSEPGIILDGVNAVLLDDCSAESIAKFLRSANSSDFNRAGIAESVKQYSWKNISSQYIDSLRAL